MKADSSEPMQLMGAGGGFTFKNHVIPPFVQIPFCIVTNIWHFNLIIDYLHISLDSLNLFLKINSHFLIKSW